ncbi:FBP domain-containing protein [Gordonia sp. TBRC 11910]|uniref:FBP domain-containing protein n=1 Tax=Gordonia asplenii TaxID=2725283 RepID=A0A848KTC6_9ACTN|nr:FBP domain-containing protein [Gordonia asplenii]NMO01247.1 FBP domain-containing protein [Gordonia asplenii]
MRAFSQSEILAAFTGATRSEVKRVTFPENFNEVDFDRLEFFGWRDRKIPRRSYVVVDAESGPVALLLTRAEAKPRGRAMCSWCNDVNLTNEAVLYTVRRAGAAGRRGATLGALVCDNFGCSKNARQLPPAFHKGTDLDAVRAERIADLRRRVTAFAAEVCSEA